MGKGQEVIVCLLLAIGMSAILFSLDSKKYPMDRISIGTKGIIGCIVGLAMMAFVIMAIGVGLGVDTAVGFLTTLLSIF